MTLPRGLVLLAGYLLSDWQLSRPTPPHNAAPELVLPAAVRPPDRRRQPLLTSRHRRECRRRNG